MKKDVSEIIKDTVNLPWEAWQAQRLANQLYGPAFRAIAPIIFQAFEEILKDRTENVAQHIASQLICDGKGTTQLLATDHVRNSEGKSCNELLIKNRRLFLKRWNEFRGYVQIALIKPLAEKLTPYGITVTAREYQSQMTFSQSGPNQKDIKRSYPALGIVFKFKTK